MMSSVEVTFVGGPKDGEVWSVEADEHGRPVNRIIRVPCHEWKPGWTDTHFQGQRPQFDEFVYQVNPLVTSGGLERKWVAHDNYQPLFEIICLLLNVYSAYKKLERGETQTKVPPTERPLEGELLMGGISRQWSDVPDGVYRGRWVAYHVHFNVGPYTYDVKTKDGIRGMAEVEVAVLRGREPMLRVVR